jgi:hypothetical protein
VATRDDGGRIEEQQQQVMEGRKKNSKIVLASF